MSVDRSDDGEARLLVDLLTSIYRTLADFAILEVTIPLLYKLGPENEHCSLD